MKSLTDFKDRWIVDYEFISKAGNPPIPICYVTQNLDSKEIISHWIDGSETKPIYPIDKSSLFIAYYASAEIGCHISLNFKIPPYMVDLFAEFRCLTNGIKVPSGRGLIGACNYFGITSSDAAYKDAMRDRILQGPPYSEKEKQDILFYCQKDVEMTTNLFTRMEKDIDFPYALLRGRYMASVAFMEHYGVPIDTKSLKELRDCWPILLDELIIKVDSDYNVYEGNTFRLSKFQEYLNRNRIPWDYTEKGRPRTDNDFMHKQAKIFPELRPLQELRYTLGQLKLNDFQVGEDGRNRCLLSPFSSKTSRNQPSSNKFIFGPAIWVRYLIKPEKGRAISYIDFEQQEIAIAGALSQDDNLIKAYQTGDAYLSFGKIAGAIPPDGTKETHPEIREKFKLCMLALNYGMSEETFAISAQIPLAEAKLMVKWHKRHYRRYWEWNSNFIDMGILSGVVRTNFHWYFNTTGAEYRTLMNWPMQSHGADILRLGITMCIDAGIQVIAPVHDAILVEDSLENIDSTVQKAQKIMEDASEYALNFRIRTEAKTIRYPDRYTDPRGEETWRHIWDIVNNINPAEKTARLQEKILEDIPLDHWESTPHSPKKNISKMRRGQLMMKPENLSEKMTAQRIKKQSSLSHIEIMHLIRMARDTDYDLEHEIDWQHESYNTAKKKILRRTIPKELY